MSRGIVFVNQPVDATTWGEVFVGGIVPGVNEFKLKQVSQESQLPALRS